MARFLISIVRPGTYAHSSAFREIAETLQFGLRRAGHEANIVENIVDAKLTNIMLGAQLLREQDARIIPPGSIIYNLEQLGRRDESATYVKICEQYRIWDYSPINVEHWLQKQCTYTPRLVEVGYTPELRRITSHPEPDIDVLFYGSVNDYRLKILRELQDTGLNAYLAFGAYGEQRDALIARSKIVLNMHHYPEARQFESVRVSYLLSNSKAVVSEDSPDIGWFKDAVAVFPYEGLVEGCVQLVKDVDERKKLEARGFEHFSQRSEADILSAVLADSDFISE